MNHPVESKYFPQQPDVLDLGDRQKELHSPYIYQWTEDYWGCSVELRFIVPAGFVYNGASVPQKVWSIYPPHSLDRAAVFHDFIYRTGGVLAPGTYQYRYPGTVTWSDFPKSTKWSRSAADRLFREQLHKDPKGPEGWRVYAAWLAVRAFGGSRWG